LPRIGVLQSNRRKEGVRNSPGLWKEDITMVGGGGRGKRKEREWKGKEREAIIENPSFSSLRGGLGGQNVVPGKREPDGSKNENGFISGIKNRSNPSARGVEGIP